MFASMTIRKPLSADIERGEYLSRTAGCMSCHTNIEGDGMLLTGGRPINSPYGVFYSTNITPDRLTGIGTWSDDDFIKALRHGRSPEGKPYYPVFPYLSYAKMRNQDILDIKAYLFAQKPIHKKNLEHRLRFPFSVRMIMIPWQWLFFSTEYSDIKEGLSSLNQRGRYLVEVLGHCTECHTPRNMLGSLKAGAHLAGTRYGPGGTIVPNITPDKGTGIGNWSEADLILFLQTGIKPNGDTVQGHMQEIIEDSLSYLTEADLRSIVLYLKSIPEINKQVEYNTLNYNLENYDDW